MLSGSLIVGPTRMRGSSDAYGSWNISWRLRRERRRLAAAEPRDVLPVEADLARRRPVQGGDEPADRGLAAARLADEPERLAAVDVEGDARDGLDRPDLALEDRARGDGEVLVGRRRAEQHVPPVHRLDPRRLALDERDRLRHVDSRVGVDQAELERGRLLLELAGGRGVDRVEAGVDVLTGADRVGQGRGLGVLGAGARPLAGTLRREQRLFLRAARLRVAAARREAAAGRRVIRSGGTPGMEKSACERSWSKRGMERNSASVYGCRIEPKSSSVPEPSAIFPAYMTITRSARAAITPRSCVMRITAISKSRRRLSIRSRIWAWIVTSSAVVGSSAISSFGEFTSAIAIITRWRRPPESWYGYAFSRSAGRGSPTSSSTSRARTSASLLRDVVVQPIGLGDLAPDRPRRVQRRHRVLEDHRHVVAAHVLHLLLAEGAEVTAEQVDRAAHDVADVREQLHDREPGRRFPAAGLADEADALSAPAP